ncbi:T9SS type A sorting domain-containing protein [Draconibacterium orientale]|uniref:Ig-like domain-containing protein n=1 Tax=Draconibacterium orientale TaxID=1168034 RepID=UPI002ABD24C3|nr:T9SS type A sorting domain-containing protein [Draconibacterium orientale]
MTATNSTLCESASSDPFTIENQYQTPAIPTVSVIPATCDDPGSASITNYAAANTYTFTPSGPAVNASGNITGATYGTDYTVTATNSTLCESASSDPFTIENQYQTPAIPTVSVIPATCDDPGSASITNYAAANTYTFTPSGPAVNASGNITGATYGTDYTVTATNSTLCESASSDPFTIENQYQTPDAPTNGTPATICFGDDNIAISASVTAGHTIDWYDEPSAGSVLLSGSLSYTSSETQPDNYTYYAEARNTTTNCVSSSRLPVEYTIKANPTLNLTSADCAPDLLTYNIVFVSNGTVTSSSGTVNNTSKKVTGITAGTDVTLTATHNGCTTQLVVNAPDCSCPVVDAPTNGAPAKICFGDDNTSISASVTAGHTIDWYATESGGSALLSGSLSYTSSETEVDVYTYYAEARNTITNCISSSRLPVNFEIKANPTLVLNDISCAEDLQTYDIVFFSDGEVSSTAGVIDNGERTVTGITAGTGVTLTATLNGCTTELVVNAPDCSCPVVDAPTDGTPAAICFGDDNTSISANVTAGHTIDWYATESGGSALLSGSLSYTSSETEVDVYTYYAEARNTTTNCVSSTRLAVSYSIKVNPTLSLVGPPNCSEDLQTYDIAFVSDGGVSSTAGVVDNTTKTVTGIPAGTDVTLTATLNGCTTDLQVNAPDCSCPVVDAPTDGTPATICFGDDNTSISAGVTAGHTIDWYADATGGTALVSGSLSYTSPETEAGNYTYYAEARNTTTNCVSSSRLPVNFEILSRPIITTLTKIDPSTCQGLGSLDFTFTDVPDGTYTISYDDGTFDNVVVSSGTASVTAAAGTYNNLQITVNGCTSAPGINASLSDPTPPPAPAISVQDNCGESVITASNYTGTLLWSTGETTESIIVTEAGSYSVTQMLNECISDAASVTAAPKTIPTLAVTKTDPLECGEMGSLNFTFTGVPDGTYSITYDAGTFSGIIVSGNTATVSAGAGAYNNLTITVNDCASPSDVNASLADPNPPPAPTVSVQDNCGESVLTASNYTGTLLWSTGETTESITVTTAGTYSLTQTVNGCMSEVASATATPKTIPTLAITATDPTACGENGSLNFTFTDVPNGNHTITYDDGTFNNVTVSSGTASVTAAAGTYNNLQITVNGCTSDAGINASLAEPTPPPAPTIALQDNCGESVITASDYTGTLLWSTGETTESIIVTEAGSYSVTQMLNECISNAASVTAAPKTVPTLAVTKTDPLECGEMGSLNFTFTGVPDGTYSITYDAGTFSGVIVSGNTATVSAAAGAYNNLTITVNDCASASDVNISLADPNPPPAPTVSVQDNCGESVLTASNYTGTLLWSNGETTESITVTTASTYSVTQTVNGCMSEVASATATPKTIPTLAITATDPTACGENGSLDFTFTNVPDGSYTISYEDGTFNNVTVSSGTAAVAATAGTYNNLQITVNGCTSDAGINASLAKPTPPPAPAISVQDNCGESVITASNYTGTLLWSTGETTESITVTEAGSYSVTQMLNECISDAASVTAAPKTVPTLAVTKTDPLVCGEMGSLNFTFTDVPDGTYSITYDAGIFSEVIVSGNTATVSAAAGAYNNLTITVNDCASASDVNASLADPNPPPAPTISVQDNCGESVLTASNYTGTLLWSTGETTESITVTTAGTYSVTQTVNGCMSDAASILATPQNGTLLPEIEVVNNCGESTITMQNLEENAWFVWKFNNQTDSTENSSIKVSEEGEYTIWQKNNNCKSLESTVTVTPYAIPSLPVANNQTSIVTDADSIIPLTAEAISDPNAVIVWFENDSGGEEITSPVLDTIGTVTYFAEALNTTTGCISPGRTPVTLTIRMDTDTITIDTTIIGKPHTNVAVLIFATDSLQYQWYMNDEKLLNATNQFYYIFESDRQNGNIFTIEVTFPDGHSSKFNYYYTGNQSSGTIDADNKSGITETETVFSIFPNPASTSFTLAIDTRQIQNIQNLTAKVFSISGVCTIEVPITQIPQRIDTKDLRPGIYSVILYNNGQWLQAKKLSITQN